VKKTVGLICAMALLWAGACYLLRVGPVLSFFVGLLIGQVSFIIGADRWLR
jgi:hypothetical protein